jgi:Sulfotransferase domain
MVMKFTLNTCLQYSGFKGEGIVDERTWINKTHFPYRIPYDNSYKTNAIICCVRNPLDVIVSNFLFLSTLTHNRCVNEKFWEYEEWDGCVTNEIRGIMKWHKYWIDAAKKQDVPVFFVRFEDLLSDPATHLKEVFKFVFCEDKIEGTNLERRLNEVVKGGNGCILYKLKAGGGSVNKHLDKFTPA